MSDILQLVNQLPPDKRAALAQLLLGAGARSPQPDPARGPVAIIGMGCRFPGGANTPAAFWELLRDGVDAVGEVPPDRWDADALYDPDPDAPGKTSSRWGGFLRGVAVDQFDAAFFGIAPREAAAMDPQHRLLLEVAYEALEDAGLPLPRLAGSRAGVFVGIGLNDYSQRYVGRDDALDIYSATGNALCMAANRLSYLFNLRGPSLAVDTACSSSLVALHLAVQSLRRGECELALAGGVSLMLSPRVTVQLSRFLSPGGRCRTFDARADGYVRGEGAGVVVLKLLERALADGDPIYAVIRGTAANQDGQTSSLTVPNGPAQQAVIRQALDDAGLEPSRVSYVEAHGTGTALGDPIEAHALDAVFGPGRPPGRPLAVGAVKSNLGHLEAAAGVAGVIKVALALRHGLIPPSLHFETPSPHIPLDQMGLRVQAIPGPWPDGAPACAGVSAFGFGGTNAHVLIEQAPARPPAAPDDAPQAHLLPISARSEAALRELARAYARSLADESLPLGDVCRSAALRRTHHDLRLAVSGEGRAALAGELHAWLEAGAPATAALGQPPRVVYAFSGQGGSWAGVGRQLLDREPAFRAALDSCDAALRPHAGFSVLEVLRDDAAEERLAATEVAQPVLFAIQVALAALWRSWGVRPDAVVGHSVGEVAAAHVAGALTLEDAARVVAARSRLMGRVAGQGKMLAADLPEAEAAALVAGGALCVAAINGPASVVFSGPPAEVDALAAQLAARGVFCRDLGVHYAFHSPQMEPLRGELAALLAAVAPRPAGPTFVSTVTGGPLDGAALGAGYWARNLREPVRFAQAVARVAEGAPAVFVEIGPHPVLARPLGACLAALGLDAPVLPSLRRGQPDHTAILRSLGALHCHGVPVDWAALYGPAGQPAPLPHYPWQRQRHWVDEAPAAAAPPADGLPGRRLGTALPTWEARLELGLPWLADYQIDGQPALPASACAALALALADEEGTGPRALADLAVDTLPAPRAGAALQATLTPDGDGALRFHLFGRAGDGRWSPHGSGRLVPPGPPSPPEPLAAVQARCRDELDPALLYERWATALTYGPRLRGLARCWTAPGEALGLLAAETLPADGLPPALGRQSAVLEAAAQTLAAALPVPEGSAAWVLVGLERLEVYGPLDVPLWCHTRPHGAGAGDLTLYGTDGGLLAAACGLRLRAAGPALLGLGLAERLPGWLYELDWRPLPSAPPADLTAGTWLILADAGGLGVRLAARLNAAGQQCVLARPSPAYGRTSDGWQVDPARPEDMRRLVADLAAAGGPPLRGAVHLWALDSPELGDMDQNDLAAAQTPLCTAALHLFQALLGAALPEPPRLWLVTRGSQPVAGATPLAALPAALWGLGRALALEHPDHWGGLIDLDAAAGPDDDAQLLAALRTGDDDQLAFRAGQRYGARLVRSAPQPAAGEVPVRPDAAYLLTGGLGALGLLVAGWLVARGARTLVLAGRSPLPPRAAWGALDPAGDDGRRVAAILQLEARGASVTYAQADVSDPAALAALVARCGADLPPLRGVVHMAGVASARPAAEMDAAALDALLRPKLQGSWALHQATLGCQLDFFVGFSSAAAVWGAAGQAAYAAGNAFLDALAHHRRRLGLPALSVNWGPWAGDGIASAEEQARLARLGFSGLRPDEGLAALAHLLAEGTAQRTVARVDWARFAPLLLARRQRPLLDELAAARPAGPAAGGPPLIASLAAAAPSERPALLSAHVRAAVSRVLRLPPGQPIGRHQGFFQAGMDSLMAAELQRALADATGLELPATLAFNYATVEALAGHLAERLLVGDEPPAPPDGQPDDGRAALIDQVEQLSEAEAEALLADELAKVMKGLTQ